MTATLALNKVSCIRSGRTLFSGLDLQLPGGQLLRVAGANGAGKTSLLRLLAGLSQPDAGEVRWNGEKIGSEAFRRELMYLGHRAAVKEDLTALENVQFAAEMDGVKITEEQAQHALVRFGLAGREELPVRFLSAGQKRRVLLARTVTRPAKLWILDEPFTALDVKAVDFISHLVADHVKAGGMAVLTSHQSIPLPPGQVVDL